VEGYVEHYNNVRLNSATGYITPKECSLGGSRRSTRSATGSWRRHGSNDRLVASEPLDVQFRPVGRDSAGMGPSNRTFAAGAESRPKKGSRDLLLPYRWRRVPGTLRLAWSSN
jgi:hypothetical protein